MAIVSASSSSLLGYQKRVQFASLSDNWAGLPTTSNGTVVTSGGYRYHTFTSSGTLKIDKSGKLEVLLVGGGGGANDKSAGGGGAGQVLNKTIIIQAGSWSVTVGAGGSSTQNTLGGHSFIGSSATDNIAVAYGGTTGWGGYTGAVSFGGACGCGGSIYEAGGQPLLNNTFFGRAGGNGAYVQGAGGGGGYGVAGSNGGGTGGAGGNGTSQFSAWGLATTTGHNVSGTVWYAGGGAGGYYREDGGTGPFGAAGLGGGGSNSSGLANTGGAGSGAGQTGGSGVVIVRVPV